MAMKPTLAVLSSVATRTPGVVVSAGKMDKTVTVRQIKPTWNSHLRKSFSKPVKYLVHDPSSSVLEGDIVMLTPERHTRRVTHVVSSIVAPFSKPLDERPPVPTAEEREAARDVKRRAKVERRAKRGVLSAISEAKRRGWVVGEIDEEASRETVVEHGREVLPDGKHRFGKINDEARRGANRAIRLKEKGKEYEAEREQVEDVDGEEIAREKLDKEGR